MAVLQHPKHIVAILAVCYVIYFYEYHIIISGCPKAVQEARQYEILKDPDLKPFFDHLRKNVPTKKKDYKMALFRDPRWRSRKPRLKVLLMSYMNAGSTYLGDVIRRSEEVFYVYHPLLVLQTFINENKGRLMYLYDKLEPLKKHELKIERRDNFTLELNRTTKQLAEETITHFLNCNFTALSFASLSNLPRIRDSQTTEFIECTREGSLVTFIKCFHLLYDVCNKTNVNVVNTVQFPVAVADLVLNDDPDVKVVYLVRDPRATLWSQFNYGVFDWSIKLTKKSRNFCKLLKSDIQAAKAILQQSDDRLLVVRYEELVNNPKEEFRRIFAFLGLNFTSAIQNYLLEHEADTECWDCVEKDNNAWRNNIPLDGAKMVDYHCRGVNHLLGYLQIPNKSGLRNPLYILEEKIRLR